MKTQEKHTGERERKICLPFNAQKVLNQENQIKTSFFLNIRKRWVTTYQKILKFFLNKRKTRQLIITNWFII